ncbi:MAG: hypothetical protein ACI9G5_001200 [Paracoccaceae bacterium]|jgi:hypothetical protein
MHDFIRCKHDIPIKPLHCKPLPPLASRFPTGVDCRPRNMNSDWMYQAALPLPPPLRILNLTGKSLRLIGIRGASLNPKRLMRRARQNTTLGDFGPDDFREGLDRLCEALEAELTAFGRLIPEFKKSTRWPHSALRGVPQSQP